MNKAPLLGVVVDARFPVIVHHRCAHDSPCTVWAPHRAHQFLGKSSTILLYSFGLREQEA